MYPQMQESGTTTTMDPWIASDVNRKITSFTLTPGTKVFSKLLQKSANHCLNLLRRTAYEDRKSPATLAELTAFFLMFYIFDKKSNSNYFEFYPDKVL